MPMSTPTSTRDIPRSARTWPITPGSFQMCIAATTPAATIGAHGATADLGGAATSVMGRIPDGASSRSRRTTRKDDGP